MINLYKGKYFHMHNISIKSSYIHVIKVKMKDNYLIISFWKFKSGNLSKSLMSSYEIYFVLDFLSLLLQKREL